MNLSQHDVEERGERSWRELLLAHYVRRERIQLGMLGRIEDLKLFDTYPDLCAIFNAVSTYRTAYGGMPTCEAIIMELQNTCDDYRIPYSMLPPVEAMVKGWYRKTDWDDTMIQDMFTDLLERQVTAQMKLTADSEEDPHKMRRALKKHLNELETDRFAFAVEENPFDNLEYYLSTVERYKTGVSFIDNMLDGGVQAGELLGIIAPSGGGKSTLAMQVSHGQVIREEHVVYFSTEQKLRGDLAVRTCVLATTRPRSDFRKSYKELSPAVQDDLLRVTPSWKRYFHFFDVSDKEKPVKSIRDFLAPVYRLVEEKKVPKIIIVDWWGRLRDYMIMHCDETNETAIRRLSRNWLHHFKQEAEALGVSIILLHQLSGEQAERSAGHKPSTHSAQEDKNFNNMMDWAFAIGKMDADAEAHFIADKARAAAKSEIKIKLDGPRCLFVYAKNTDYVQDGPMQEQGQEEEEQEQQEDFNDDSGHNPL